MRLAKLTSSLLLLTAFSTGACDSSGSDVDTTPPEPVVCTGPESGDFQDVEIGLPTETPELEPNSAYIAQLVRANGKVYLGLRIDAASTLQHRCLGQLTTVTYGGDVVIGEEDRYLALTPTPDGREITAPLWIQLTVDPPSGASLHVLTVAPGQQQSQDLRVP
jgi:hypothetical protein